MVTLLRKRNFKNYVTLNYINTYTIMQITGSPYLMLISYSRYNMSIIINKVKLQEKLQLKKYFRYRFKCHIYSTYSQPLL